MSYYELAGYQEYWESCGSGLAHMWENYKSIPERWETWKGWFDFQDKLIIDYGCGGAWLYDYLKRRGIRGYVGLDIAQRQIDFCRSRLEKKEDVQLYLLPYDLSKVSADILICQQVLSHLISQGMVDYIIDNINASGIPELLLEIAPHPNEEKCEFETKSEHSACSLGTKYLGERLGYELVKKEENAQYLFTKWKRK